ncbi:MAG: ACT domain-containing protein [Nitrosopumilaceae archaeon]|nr:ACT domain-containing protein [Nitrosopumilaceae archaeon]
MSVPDIVKEIITHNRSIYDCMKMDIINYTALAVKIQPEVERIIGSQANLNTIVVAIKRYSDSFEEKDNIKREAVLKNARLSLTDKIMDVKFSLDGMDNNETSNIMDKFSHMKSDYEFFRLADSFIVLAEDIDDVREVFSTLPNNENLFNTGLAKLKITLINNENRSDVTSYITELLHNNGIEMKNAFFSLDSIIIIIDAKDASKAYQILYSEINR